MLNFIFKKKTTDQYSIPTTNSIGFGLGNPDTSINQNENMFYKIVLSLFFFKKNLLSEYISQSVKPVCFLGSRELVMDFVNEPNFQ